MAKNKQSQLTTDVRMKLVRRRYVLEKLAADQGEAISTKSQVCMPIECMRSNLRNRQLSGKEVTWLFNIVSKLKPSFKRS